MSETAEIIVPEPVSGKIAELVREILVQLGENRDREGLPLARWMGLLSGETIRHRSSPAS